MAKKTKKSELITSTEIRQRLGIRAQRTLTRWHQRGLIPAPVIATHPSGRGKLAYWPRWVFYRCQELCRATRSGARLDEVDAVNVGPSAATRKVAAVFAFMQLTRTDLLTTTDPKTREGKQALALAAVLEAGKEAMLPGFLKYS